MSNKSNSGFQTDNEILLKTTKITSQHSRTNSVEDLKYLHIFLSFLNLVMKVLTILSLVLQLFLQALFPSKDDSKN